MELIPQHNSNHNIHVCVCVCVCARACAHTHEGACKNQKRELDHLELELPTVVNHLKWMLDAGNQKLVLLKSSKCLSPINHLSGPNSVHLTSKLSTLWN